MGGRAFPYLNCPRIFPDIYANVKMHTTAALHTVFSHVTVPIEMPEKFDYGDIDFLVAGPLHSPISTSIDNFDWSGTVNSIKSVFNTIHGRRGFFNCQCMYFAIQMPGHEDEDLWVQVDVKVCFKPELFDWEAYELSYATIGQIKGSMIKPLGLTIDPEGLHIRVEDVDEKNFPGSMLWISKDPRDVLRIMGLDRRVLDAAFKTKDELYEYIAGSWLFNPAHFISRLAEAKYSRHLDDRAPYWITFVKEWTPRHYPGYQFASDRTSDPEQLDLELSAWSKTTRAAVREKIFTMFPDIAVKYYVKRAAYTRELEEQRLRNMIMEAIPQDQNGWRTNLPQPHIIIEQDPTTSEAKSIAVGEIMPPIMPYNPVFPDIPPNSTLALTPPVSPACLGLTPSRSSTQTPPPSKPWAIPLYMDTLPRAPPSTCIPSPPSANMATEKRLLCLARWTLWDPATGKPYLLSSPRDKDFNMCWADAVYAGATDEDLTMWARGMWWHIWIRQSHTNHVGMWKKRFEKEDRKAEKAMKEESRNVGGIGTFDGDEGRGGSEEQRGNHG